MPQKKTEQLIKVYQEAQARLIYILGVKQARRNVTAYQESLLKQVNAELARLDKKAKKWTSENIPKDYKTGAGKAISEVRGMGLEIGDYESFSKLHRQSIELLAANMIEDLTDATHFVGRHIKDTIQKAGMDAIATSQATGSTVKEAQRLVKQNLIREGINGIKDRRGRMISLDAYAATVARSTTREATNKAKMTQLQANGYDLVQMTSHSSPCSVCAPLEGRVYSVSGNDARYPPLDKAFGSHANIHPNCGHSIVPYISSLADNPEDDKKFSNRPFDIDARSKKEKERYHRQQKEKRQRRSDRNQYRRYKVALGKDAPKSFGGFRRSKQSDSDHWQELQSDYQKTMRKISDD